MPDLTVLPTLPAAPNSVTRPSTFVADADATFGALPGLVTAWNTNVPVFNANVAGVALAAAAAAADADDAAASKTAASSSALLAYQWANKTDGPVSGGEYSAKYWAQQALGSVASIPAGAINDVAIGPTTVWSSQKVNASVQPHLFNLSTGVI